MKANQKGFGIVEGLLIIVALGIVGFAGWYVYDSNKKTNQSYDKSAATVQNTYNDTAASSPELKEYKSEEFGFSFKYPSTWTLKEDLEDMGRGGREGDITVTSPKGTIVHFGPNFGGKGGDCADENDQHTPKTCSTKTIITVEKLPSSVESPIYFYHMSLKDSDNSGGKTKYHVTVEGGNKTYAYKETGSTVGAFIYPYDEVYASKYNLTIYVEGKDDSKNNSEAFFESNEVKEATPVLKSFRLI